MKLKEGMLEVYRDYEGRYIIFHYILYKILKNKNINSFKKDET